MPIILAKVPFMDSAYLGGLKGASSGTLSGGLQLARNGNSLRVASQGIKVNLSPANGVAITNGLGAMGAMLQERHGRMLAEGSNSEGNESGEWPYESTNVQAEKLQYESCDECANNIQNAIGGEKIKITNKYGEQFYLGPVKVGKTKISNWYYHVVVKKGNRVFDRITGPNGMEISEYQSLWDFPDDLNFQHVK